MDKYLRSTLIRFRAIFPTRGRLLLVGSLIAGVFLLFLFASNRVVPQAHQPIPLPPDGVRPMGSAATESSSPLPLRMLPDVSKAGPLDSASPFREPRIAYSAELTVVTREFAHSRSSLEDILDRHRGYVAKLRMVGQPSGSVLSATLRVPSSEYRSALAELKAVGLVEHEEEAADEITQQRSELEGRLVNAQNEEQRLLQLLQNRRDKANDPAALERQVALLRGEIERMQTERYASGSRVSFANVFFSLREERTSPAETIGAKLRNAAVSGMSDAFESISTILLFLAGRGPLFAFWAALVYFPARYFWRRFQRVHGTDSSLAS